jgi:stage II sporulation protein D
MILEEYVAGCVAAELGTSATVTPAVMRMYQVQAILCRTFASANRGRHTADGYDLCAMSHCQLYRPPRPSAPATRFIQDAVDATRGAVIEYEGRPIQALYHAHCGGRTSAAAAIWGGRPEPYLVSVVDSLCQTGSRWRLAIERGRLRDLLNRAPRTAVGPSLDGVEVTARDEAERATTVVLSGTRSQRIRGEEFRTAVMLELGSQSMRSTRFWIRREGDLFVIEGSGSGHGVGLCQAGAMSRAEAGESPEAIIRHYYPGARVGLR